LHLVQRQMVKKCPSLGVWDRLGCLAQRLKGNSSPDGGSPMKAERMASSIIWGTST
jgi:hypothetical protein